MAKKKKGKSQPETSVAAASRAAPATEQAGEASSIERAFAVGNFSAVRRLAAQHPGAEADRLLTLAKIEPVQLLIGLGALLVMVVVALMVLRSG